MCKLWECHNTYCPNYAGNGIRLGIAEIERDPLGQHGCKRCGTLVRERRESGQVIGKSLVMIAFGGLLGAWATGSLTGAFVGAGAGAVVVILAES